MIALVRRPAAVGAGIVFRPTDVRRLPTSLIRPWPYRVRVSSLIVSHISKPAVIGDGIVFRPPSIYLISTLSRVQYQQRQRLMAQPYLQESLSDTVLGQPPVIITVWLPRR